MKARQPAGRGGSRLRLARVARGLTQEQLARSAGITRQSIAGIESGRWEPSLRVAIAIAAALGSQVEELFAPEPPAELASVNVEEDEGSASSRLCLARVGGRTTAFPLGAHASLSPGFRLAHAAVDQPDCMPEHDAQESMVRLLAASSRPPALVIAGCDPAIALLGPFLQALSQPVEMVWLHTNNSEAIELLLRGSAHVAGLHGEPHGPPPWRGARLAGIGGDGVAVVGFSSWREGLAYPARQGELTLPEVASARMRLANREPGSRARELLDAERKRHGLGEADLLGYESAVRGHMLVASALASGLAEAGITSEPAAATFGLGFTALAEENFDFVLRRESLADPVVQALLEVLGSPALQAQLGSIPGYDARRCGEVVSEHS